MINHNNYFKIKKSDFIRLISSVLISFIAYFLKLETLCLIIAGVQLYLVIRKAKVSIFSVLTFLLNFCLLQQYIAYVGGDVYGILSYSHVPYYYYELCVCVYGFNNIMLAFLYFTNITLYEERLFKVKIDVGFSLSCALTLLSLIITILIFPTLPSLSQFTIVNRFTGGYLPFAGWSCIPYFFLAVSIMNKKARKYVVACAIFVLLWFVLHGERVDGIGFICFLGIVYYYHHKDSHKAKVVILGAISIVVVSMVLVGLVRSGIKDINIMTIISGIIVQDTACDVTYVFNCAVDLYNKGNQFNGITYSSYVINCIPTLNDPFSFQTAIHEFYYTAGGGLFFAEPVANFGLAFCAVFCFFYVGSYYILLKKTTQYRFMIYASLCIMVFRTAWYGLNYPITTILYFVPFVYILSLIMKGGKKNGRFS